MYRTKSKGLFVVPYYFNTALFCHQGITKLLFICNWSSPDHKLQSLSWDKQPTAHFRESVFKRSLLSKITWGVKVYACVIKSLNKLHFYNILIVNVLHYALVHVCPCLHLNYLEWVETGNDAAVLHVASARRVSKLALGVWPRAGPPLKLSAHLQRQPLGVAAHGHIDGHGGPSVSGGWAEVWGGAARRDKAQRQKLSTLRRREGAILKTTSPEVS